jgi:hypothetical protein
MEQTSVLPMKLNERWLAASKPTAFTRFWRVFVPWQLWRFAAINIRMIRIIGRGHR